MSVLVETRRVVETARNAHQAAGSVGGQALGLLEQIGEIRMVGPDDVVAVGEVIKAAQTAQDALAAALRVLEKREAAAIDAGGF